MAALSSDISDEKQKQAIVWRSENVATPGKAWRAFLWLWREGGLGTAGLLMAGALPGHPALWPWKQRLCAAHFATAGELDIGAEAAGGSVGNWAARPQWSFHSDAQVLSLCRQAGGAKRPASVSVYRAAPGRSGSIGIPDSPLDPGAWATPETASPPRRLGHTPHGHKMR